MKSRKPTGNPEFEVIFARLREILRKHAGRLSVKEDTSTRYCLSGGSHPTHKVPMDIAWVQIGKAYVSFHHMGVYGCERLRDRMSPELKARLQGKSCFNFTKQDESLFTEIEKLTIDGFDAFRTAGFCSDLRPDGPKGQPTGGGPAIWGGKWIPKDFPLLSCSPY